MFKDELLVLIGGPEDNIPGSRQYECAACKVGVWLSPMGQAMLSPQVQVMCLRCASRAKPDEWGLVPGAMGDWLRAILAIAIWRARN